MPLELQPELQRRIDSARRAGDYGSDAEVISAALDALAKLANARGETTQAGEPIKPMSRRQKAAIGLLAAQCVTVLIALAAATVEIESIVWSGPALAAIGVALAYTARPLHSFAVTAFGLSGPMLAAFGAGLIAAFGWGPNSAKVPITSLIAIYALIAVPWAVFSLRRILAWTSAPLPQFVWQFSLKSLIVAMTALCLLLVLLRGAMMLRGEMLGFALFSIAMFGVTSVVLYGQSEDLIARLRRWGARSASQTCRAAEADEFESGPLE